MQGLKIEDQAPADDQDVKELHSEIRRKRHAFREEHMLNRNNRAHSKIKDLSKMKEAIVEQGLDPTLVEERLRSRSRSKSLFAIKNKKAGQMLDEDA